MRTLYSFLIIFLLLPSISAQKSNSDLAWPKVTTECKPFARWWWLGSGVDKVNLSWNLEELSKAGIGGLEITPIYGVKGMESKNISYLSPEWMTILTYTINEAKRLGMNIDMATGTGWPFGGPNITLENAASKMIIQTYKTKEGSMLTQRMIPTEKNQQEAKLQALMAFSDLGEKKNIISLLRPDGLVNWIPGEGNWTVIALFCGKTQQKVKRSAPGGEGLVMDHFSSKALDTYLERFNTAFSESKSPFPKTFFNDSYEVYNADWSPVFLDEFKKRRSYALEDHLIEFSGVGDNEDISRVKSDYRETMSDVLLENFTQRWTEWAHTKGAITRNQAHGSPGNLIDFYSAVDIPECESFGTTIFDIPGLRRDTGFIRAGNGDPMMFKFASSGAHISGKQYTSSETFTWLGDHFRVSLSQCKPQLDEIFVSGVNHIFFHGTPYSPQEAAWPGWQFYAAVNFSPTNRFWCDIPAMNQYITRCQSFLQMGKPDNDFLLYFPIYDVWHNSKDMDMPLAIHTIDKWLQLTSFYKTGKVIQEMGYDLDYISDRILRNAKVVGGKIVSSGNTYKALIIPACRFMQPETLKAILDLARNGASVIFINGYPDDVPGLSKLDERRKEFNLQKESLIGMMAQSEKGMVPFNKGQLAISSDLEKAIGFLNIPREGISEHKIKYIRRQNVDGYHYFLANLQSIPLDSWVKLSVDAASAVIFDPLAGKSGIAKIRKQNGRTEVYLQLNPGESVILKTYSVKNALGTGWAYFKPSGNTVELTGPWSLTFPIVEPRIDKNINLQKLQSWTELGDTNLIKFSGTGKYNLEFELPNIKAAEWVLELGEVRESAKVKVNGKDAGTLWSIPFKTKIGQYLKPGKNLLEIEVTNIDANRIADYDRKKVNWKIFYDINIVNVNYKPFDASGWSPMPSGLLGPVKLIPLEKF